MQEYIEETSTGIYRVTSNGKIYSQTKRKIPIVGKEMEFTGQFKYILEPERELATNINNRGYRSVCLMKTTYMIHRLVAKAFIDNPDNKPFVNHIDGNKLNNDVSNLEWCTAAENNAHARRTGLHIQAKGHKINYKSKATKQIALSNLKDKSKLTPEEVRYCRTVHVPRCKQYSATALAEKFGVSVAAMSKIVSGQTYQHVN